MIMQWILHEMATLKQTFKAGVQVGLADNAILPVQQRIFDGVLPVE
jgi:hypothetical protein